MNFICGEQENIKFQLLNKLNLSLGKMIVENSAFACCLSRHMLFFCDDIAPYTARSRHCRAWAPGKKKPPGEGGLHGKCGAY